MNKKGFVTVTQNRENFNLPLTFPVENFGFVEGRKGFGCLITLAKPSKKFWVEETPDEVLRRVKASSSPEKGSAEKVR